ncbi:ATP-binding protein [Caldalkalibacillus mannanilyticus]|uniref:ATP-binding protein n=1 Tax=Caldalkalibacillus mannanilyticus TaxID=1418 RepID=UPI000ACCC501
MVYQNKVDELTSYGQHIIADYGGERHPRAREQVLQRYSFVLHTRNIRFGLFDHAGQIFYPEVPDFPRFTLSPDEWNTIKAGQPVFSKYELKRFDQAVTFVVLPHTIEGQLVGGILLTSPISGSREMISQINQYLLYTIVTALSVSFLLSLILSRIHVKRIQRIRDATSMISAGNYDVHISSKITDEVGELAEDFNQMAQKLKASQEEIESLENRRRQFMADVSHELRTPLTTISGVIEGIRNHMIAEEEKDKGIHLVSQETKRLIRLVNENLDYEKIRSNQVTFHKQSIQVIEVFEIIKEQLAAQAEEKENRIEIEADQDVVIYADYDRLIQILMNITKNSIQFTTSGSISLRGKAGLRETIIEIEDTGIGIDPNEIEQIWKRFYKVDLSRTNNPYGEFGLGLSIVKQLVQLQGGSINVVSEKDKGTTFIIRMPEADLAED